MKNYPLILLLVGVFFASMLFVYGCKEVTPLENEEDPIGNTPPTVVTAIPDIDVDPNSSPIENYRYLDRVFNDAEDGTDLDFTIESNSNPDLTTVTINAESALDLSFASDASGSASIVVRATDSESATVEDRFVVRVGDVSNTPPTVVAAIPDVTVTENSQPLNDYRNLHNVFDDAEDGSELDFTIASNSNSDLTTVTIDNDNDIDISFAADATGTATIVVRATDSESESVDDQFVVTVNGGGGGENNPPTVVSAIPDITVSENSDPINNHRDLNNVFDDAEDGNDLAFTIASNSNSSLTTVTIDANNYIDLSFASNTTGTATIVVRATDSESATVDDRFVVTVNPSQTGAVPDFSLTDNNSGSPTYGDTFSPRDYLGAISAWFFGCAT